MKFILKNNVYLWGDVHGNLRGLSHFITDFEEHSNLDIIVLGDCGLMHEEWSGDWKSIDKKANNKDIKIYIFRGNHDNPDFFKHENSLNNVIILEDFDEVFWFDKIGRSFSGLIYGGSLSVDRSWRWKLTKDYGKKNIWFENEILKPIPENICKYDFILGHGGITPPSIASNPSFLYNFTPYDKSLLDDIKAEQEQYKLLLEKVKPEYFFFGHFHKSESFKFNDINCQALDINEYIKFDIRKKEEDPTYISCRIFENKPAPKGFF